MEFSRQEYWSGLTFPPPGDLPDPGIEPTSLVSPALAGRFFTTEPSGKPLNSYLSFFYIYRVGLGISLAHSLATCCAEAPVVVAWHLVSRAGWKLPPGNGSAFPGGPCTWLPGRGRSVPFILACSPVHLLQEGSGPPFEPPVKGEGVEGGVASQGR